MKRNTVMFAENENKIMNELEEIKDEKERLLKAVVISSNLSPLVTTLVLTNKIQEYYLIRKELLKKSNKINLLKELEELWKGYKF
ncbi:hypothetical protein [Clostridium thermobutyricum]|uniref:hypothetical protein n=1 Tax=Clostridium thermobutyricum TaxID=29372 RepID=UPI0018AC52AB|nr:hypothetical protein [Clostridium thermobutyricum]